jgi:hypothetical protein
MRLGRLWFQAHSSKKKKKVCETPISMEKSWVRWWDPVVSATAGSKK